MCETQRVRTVVISRNCLPNFQTFECHALACSRTFLAFRSVDFVSGLPFFGACVLLCRLGMLCANGPHILRPRIFDGRTMTKTQNPDELLEKGKPKQAKQALKTGEVSCDELWVGDRRKRSCLCARNFRC